MVSAAARNLRIAASPLGKRAATLPVLLVREDGQAIGQKPRADGCRASRRQPFLNESSPACRSFQAIQQIFHNILLENLGSCRSSPSRYSGRDSNRSVALMGDVFPTGVIRLSSDCEKDITVGETTLGEGLLDPVRHFEGLVIVK